MKVTLEGFQKIQQYKELGLSKKKTAEKFSALLHRFYIFLLIFQFNDNQFRKIIDP